jgi:pimeloyl-ACP methyl ester carboxylesterase
MAVSATPRSESDRRNDAATAEPDRVELVDVGEGRWLQARIWQGDDRTVAFVHGLLSSGRTWRRVARWSTHTCVAFDLPGFGASASLPQPSLEAYASDVAAALSGLGVRGCTLVGHSFGGPVAVRVAERSAAVEALVLLAPGGYGRSFVYGALTAALLGRVPRISILALAAWIAATEDPATTPSILRNIRRALCGEPVMLRSSLFALAGSAMRTCEGSQHAAAAAQRAAAELASGTIPPLSFTGPVALLWGRRDMVVPIDQLGAVAAAFPQARVVVLDDAGHAPHRKRPKLVARVVDEMVEMSTAHRPCRWP